MDPKLAIRKQLDAAIAIAKALEAVEQAVKRLEKKVNVLIQKVDRGTDTRKH